ncbi:MAG: CRTAC1 family protein [Acidobacteriota bacterium]|nr:MAG: CRTAC1 family protein [Acidobacteriota bacterium]
MIPQNFMSGAAFLTVYFRRFQLASLALALCSVIGVASGYAAEDAASHFYFVDVAREAGISRVVLAGRPAKDHLLDSAGTGAAWLDYNRDGYLDAYIVNSWTMEGSKITERGKNALYRNRGDGTFDDVTDAAGVGGEGHWGAGVAAADFDQDGWVDILVTNFGPNVLYRNLANGRFENVAPAAGIEQPGWNTGAVFLDADGDRDLDLFIAGYIDQGVEAVLNAKPSLDWKGIDKVAMGPFGLPGAPDHFFLSNGDGTFVEATAKSGLTDLALGFGFAARAADFDDDGDLDIYVANDSDANYLYRNEGNGTFKETGLWSGAALDANGAAQAGMGVAVGDADGDGILDIIVTNFSEDFPTLYKGLGEGYFEDVSEKTGVGPPMFDYLSWGTTLSDLDNDSDLDIVISNGHIYPQVDDHAHLGFTYRELNTLLENDGSGRFQMAGHLAGPGFAVQESSRGLAVGDYDNDGDLDLLFTNLEAPPTLLRNDSKAGAWLTLICEVEPGTGPLIGTQARITVGSKQMYRDIASGDSYVSSHDPRLHFGLGDATLVDKVEVRWPDGTRTTLEQVEANQFIRIKKP